MKSEMLRPLPDINYSQHEQRIDLMDGTIIVILITYYTDKILAHFEI